MRLDSRSGSPRVPCKAGSGRDADGEKLSFCFASRVGVVSVEPESSIADELGRLLAILAGRWNVSISILWSEVKETWERDDEGRR